MRGLRARVSHLMLPLRVLLSLSPFRLPTRGKLQLAPRGATPCCGLAPQDKDECRKSRCSQLFTIKSKPASERARGRPKDLDTFPSTVFLHFRCVSFIFLRFAHLGFWFRRRRLSAALQGLELVLI